jgi:hypothetical protein
MGALSRSRGCKPGMADSGSAPGIQFKVFPT